MVEEIIHTYVEHANPECIHTKQKVWCLPNDP